MNKHRRKDALDIRITAAEIAYEREHPTHIANGDEAKFSGDEKYLSSFTKGLPHDHDTGLLKDEKDFRLFVHAIRTGEPIDFVKTPLGPGGNANNPKSEFLGNKTNKVKVRAWESQGAGHTFDLEGPDAQSVTMPPAPELGSDELTAEMAEVYSQSILRDVPFVAMMKKKKAKASDTKKVTTEIGKLKKLNWFSVKQIPGLSDNELSRRRGASTQGGPISLQNVFRGQTKGDNVGPYISQFLLAGDKGLDGKEDPADGYISYGSIRIDQRVRTAKQTDYMTTWDEWFDVQNGAKLGQKDIYKNIKKEGLILPSYRFITTPRDLATYVHNDALYEAYLNACLLLLNNEYKFDPGIPFQDEDKYDHQQGFAHFGGPHILSLVTEVATRALKAVRYQKFNIHRRMRPEVLAARLEKHNQPGMPAKGKKELSKMFKALTTAGYFNKKGTSRLLPMGFREGSPMHPSYGAGHAAVAGACVTILKAFFDHSASLTLAGDASREIAIAEFKKAVNDALKKATGNVSGKATITEFKKVVAGALEKAKSNVSKAVADALEKAVADALEKAVADALEKVAAALKKAADDVLKKAAFIPPSGNKDELEVIILDEPLTVEGELNKLASNIAIGRDWAGVHYYTDYIESLRMGEKIAIGILEEQKLTYNEEFSMTVPLFDGGTVTI